MEKNKINVMILGVIVFSIIFGSSVFAGSFVDDTSTEFNLGVYNWTAWKISDVLLSGELPDAGVNSAVDTTGLVGLWHLNGDAIDTSGNNNDGTISGAVSTDGKLNTALSFDGENDYVDVGTPLGSTSSGTKAVSLWVKSIEATTGYFIANYDSNSHGFSLLFNSDRTIGIAWTSAVNAVQTTDTLPLNEWFHVVGIFETGATGGKIYIDGTESVSGNLGTEQTTTNKVRISGRWVTANSGSTVVFNGKIDEVAIYNRALSADEILAIYNAQKDNYPSSGDYESKIHDAGSNAEWQNITWAQDAPYGEELPDNGVVETVSGGANMSGNVLLMHMDEASGTIQDTSGNNNDGTASGGVTYGASGNFDKALSFDGSTGYVERSYDPDFTPGTNSWTVEAWIKTSSGNSGKSIVDWYRCGADSSCSASDSAAYLLGVSSNNKSYWYVRDDYSNKVTLVSPSSVVDNSWHHLVGTYSPSPDSIKLYVDGVEVNSSSSVNFISLSSGGTSIPLEIGRHYIKSWGSPSSYFNGLIDEVAIYNRALSADEILDHYKRGALRLNISVKSCDDADCDGETTWDKTCTSSPCDISSLSELQYMQYKIDMQSDSSSTPEVSSVSVFYGVFIPPFTVGGTELMYRKPVNVTENSGSSLTDYQVLLTVDTASLISEGKMQADCDDIRITDSDGSTELSYWLESGCNTSGTKVWVKVPSLAASSTKTIYMYYGNSTASSASDGRNTFMVWDDFDGGTEQWTELDGSGLITIDRTTNKRINFALAGQTNERVYIDKGSDIGNFLMDYKLHISSDGRSNVIFAGVSDTLSWGSTFNDAIHGDIYTQRAGNQNKWPLVIMSDGVVNRPGAQDENYEGQDLYFRLIRHENECQGYIYSDANRTILDASGNLSCTLTNLRYVYAVTNWYNDPGYITTMTGYVDDILVRNYTSVEPTSTFGTEQQDVGASCTVDSDCLSDNCDLDIGGVTKYCHASATSCVDYNLGDPWERADTYSTCYDNDDYTCSNSVWQNSDCGSDTSCGYYVDLAAVCSAASCISCPTSCTLDNQCDANAHCDNTCIADLAVGNVCDENSDCISSYCYDDYDAGMFCADSSTDCVHDGVSYDHGIVLFYRWTCNNSAWDEDTTPPNTLSISNVEQNPTPTLGYYWDSNNNGNTTIIMTADEEVRCRVGENDQDYSSMTGSYWECTFNTISDIACVIPGLSEDRYTYYVSCRDLAGNDQNTDDNTHVTFGIDYTKPTTSVLDTAGNHLQGHSVTIDESDNLGTIAEIVTKECHPDSGCSPTTIIDHGSTVAFSIRGTNYIRWYSIDAAGNEQNVMEDTVTINSLPTISAISNGLDGYTGKTGSQVIFYCDIADANGGIGSNYDVRIWVKRTGSGTWDKLDNVSMNYDSVNRFKKEMSIGIDGYGVSYDVMCQATDDMEETGLESTQDEVFSVVNSAPIVDDITIQQSVSKFDTMRIYCDGSDPDGLAESDLTATLYMKTDAASYPPWDRINGIIMSWDSASGNHYYDFYVEDDGTTEYDIRCVLNDCELDGTRDEFKFEDNAMFVSIVDDWDGDGISDSTDTLEGTGSNLDTSLSVTILVDGIEQNDTDGVKPVEFKVDGDVFVKFNYDFSANDLDMPLISFDRSETEVGSVLVKGLAGISKTLHVPKVLGIDRICVKNAEITSISEITSGCAGDNETLFTICDTGGETIGSITCTDEGTYYELTGLTHSAAKEDGTARLNISSEGTYWQLDTINFFANYTNTTNHTITGADCDIWFEDTGWDNMTFDGSLHNYNRTFTVAGYRDYNVSCTHATYTDLTINDSFTISSSAIPEFSLITLGLGLIVILIGLIVIRRNKKII